MDATRDSAPHVAVALVGRFCRGRVIIFDRRFHRLLQCEVAPPRSRLVDLSFFFKSGRPFHADAVEIGSRGDGVIGSFQIEGKKGAGEGIVVGKFFP